MDLANKFGIKCETDLLKGLDRTINWYLSFGKTLSKKKYNYFLKKNS